MWAILLFTFSVAASALAAASLPPEAVVPGILDFGDERTQKVLNAVPSAEVRKDYKLIINTFGGGCEREGNASVIYSSTGASIFVYDITGATRPNVICTAVIKRLPHHVTLRFEKPGEALLQIWGRRVGPETPPMGVPFVLEQRVTVR